MGRSAARQPPVGRSVVVSRLWVAVRRSIASGSLYNAIMSKRGVVGRYHAYDSQSAPRGRGERSDNSGSLRVVRTIERQNTLPMGRSTA